MNLLEYISLAFSSLRAGKMRALLTMLGIIIGIGSVIAIVTIGNSLTSYITNTMNDMGANSININLRQKDSNNPNIKVEDSDRITQDMIDDLVTKYGSDIGYIYLADSGGGGKAKDGRKYANVSISGVSSGIVKAMPNQVKLVEGRDLTERDEKGMKNVALVSDKFCKKMFPTHTSYVGQEVKVYTSTNVHTYVIVGVYEYKIPAMFASFVSEDDISTDLYIPITTCKKQSGSPDGFTNFTIFSAPGADNDDVVQKVEDFFGKLYNKNPRYTVYAFNNQAMMEQMSGMLGTLSIAISVIAAISLLVGGIGVMNIMLVSVTERTREIGTRKALGARPNAIRAQFIVESMIICLIGGIIGIILGMGLGALGGMLLKFPASPDIGAIVIAVVFSMVIGIFFGYYPASKAAKLDPIEALRYE